jgi:excinuclease ABC subunit A
MSVSDDQDAIRVRGARQNNLKNLSLDIPLNELIVVTGVSGSGKSSLVFDTLYAEGQRRYVETFSPYARQFLDRMDKPQVERIEGIPPSIAIDQVNPVRTSRSTVGTMTELNDHLKLLFARAAQPYCECCGSPVKRYTPDLIYDDLKKRAAEFGDPRLLLNFRVPVLKGFKVAEIQQLLQRQGYSRFFKADKSVIEVIQDRLKISTAERSRVIESIETALRVGQGRMNCRAVSNDDPPHSLQLWSYSSQLECPTCNTSYREPVPSMFSFNSPVGACEACRGFGRTIGIDLGLVIPDASKSLRGGAVKPWQTAAYAECQQDLEKFAKLRNIPLDRSWRELSVAQQQWVIEGEGEWTKNIWYGIKRFFKWLETKSYKMHVRVLLSRYRAYTSCETCNGARLKKESLLWRLGDTSLANQVLGTHSRFRPAGVQWSDATLRDLPGLCIHDISLLPLSRTSQFFADLRLPKPLDETTDLLLNEIRARLKYLNDVGLGYLTLDRQSRTLSGGEVQRINLTTALGTSLVNTLFVLDEPSIGLHPRDMQRIIGVMQRLRDAGNSLLVVEHDPQIMLQADRILDIGPGAGEHGGDVIFFGPSKEIINNAKSLTGAYLSGRKVIEPALNLAIKAPIKVPTAEGVYNRWLEIRGVTANNLKNIDVRIPLKRLVCITGVSGSGKSTLVEDVLYPALLKHQGKPTEAPGSFATLHGADFIDDVVMVDQSSLGRTTRSNPASYVGAFDGIRQLFANEPVARDRKYTAGTFSFNSGNGRCPTCSGTGFEHVEMQFLSDVYLRCQDCDGTRYRNEILEIKLASANGRHTNIAEVLDMTVTEALDFFKESRDIVQRLMPLADVGLDYVRLGQPVPTLSGGEAQRLKLASHLAEVNTLDAKTTHRGHLFLFDEPTTGLHFDDVAKLLRAFRKLLAAGHSLLVIEHNLDLIRAADWIVDLGPEGGENGGCILVAGNLATVLAAKNSFTAQALREHQNSTFAVAEPDTASYCSDPTKSQRNNALIVRSAREHNLKNIDVTIPHNRFTVITGVSGSGKSTLAFDIIFNEGQRRYLESLNAYARQFVQPAARPDVDAIYGIPPTVAIEQRTSRGGYKSTVATLTEIYHFLRLLYVKLGVQYCPTCNVAIEPQSEASITAQLSRRFKNKTITVLAPLIVARKGYYTELAKWAAKKGFKSLRVDGHSISTRQWPRLSRFKEHTIELPVAMLDIKPSNEPSLQQALHQALEFGNGVVHILEPTANAVAVYSIKRACPSCGSSFAELDPRLLSFNSLHGWCVTCHGSGIESNADDSTDVESHTTCTACSGQRLNPVALNVRFQNQSIAELTAKSIRVTSNFFSTLKLGKREREIARDLLQEIRGRLDFLQTVGLSYLTLDRAAPTLSGGEAQRMRLAAQLGSNLQGVCYVLDEPTIGLHPRDNAVLLDSLTKLSRKRNTLVVVEHDEDTIRRADYVLDLGPAAGVRGGEVIASGTVEELINNPQSVTGRYLKNPIPHPAKPLRPVNNETAFLKLERITLHNIKQLDVKIPLNRLVVITGVSGSGKSTVARTVLFTNLRNQFASSGKKPPKLSGCRALRGLDAVDRVLEVDQTPIGKTPRSCPATYIGFWDDIRRIYTETTEAKIRGYSISRFSFNTKGGRCESCEGQGVQTVEMNFLPDVKIPCDSCNGKRFNPETLSILWRGKAVGDILLMSVDDAVEFFSSNRRIHQALKLLQDVGLGYLTLGQQSPTLSGGEAQRIKLVTELAKVSDRGMRPAKHTLYVLDEPTVGLHMADVEKLIHVLHRLVDSGGSVVIVEHNLDIIAEADWVIDMGPEAGEHGGQLVIAGPPAKVMQARSKSHTGRVLHDYLTQHSRAAS